MERGMELHPKVTFLVGENGTGKSTLLEGQMGVFQGKRQPQQEPREPVLLHSARSGDDSDEDQRAADGRILPAGGEFL
jgi:recombinational DNA repair ATPase RecF